ncbi:ABC transporter ATP-binding protein [Comamonas endophytica]|uniref:ABC transporter ATP-binding protein n=1 Tax=Comamonas endophytica TaxID=2949090 RepID=A0ABY6G7Y5_9BURK|nr:MULTISPECIES: ABC transporter ATP-binding protein [unclassified Acidovorax]MCD2511081.1 ABC transporter ATP-binding protein [Acidovorax sp. D4N7]UYG50485.1 ABC transporter ATP-binding protein [Acidovorax sp. 5MLIR]
MSSEISIKVENIRKCYQIYDKPRDRLKQYILPRLQRLSGQRQQRYFREFWALNDVSFEIRKGETVGIIGRNGSGKSTLLQVICGTLNPTAGSVSTHGRIAALLELGAGFNPEFTGRENVYMNGAVLGLSKEEIDQRFDRIAAFADIGEFIEQPVKSYSSGMYVRLAFAVIAHVDAEILVIDEALAVGDAVFTQKCMRFLRKFKERGTLIFVSHDMGSVLNLCERVVWLHGGNLRKMGPAKEISEEYYQYTLQEIYGKNESLQSLESLRSAEMAADRPENAAQEDVSPPFVDYGARVFVAENLSEANGWKTGAGEIVSIQWHSLQSGRDEVLQGGEMIRMVITAKVAQDLARPILGFMVKDRLGQDLFGENTLPFTNLHPLPVSAGSTLKSEYIFRLPMLPNGQYTVMASLADGDLHSHVQHHWLHDALILNVSSSEVRWGLVGVPFQDIKLEVTA